MLDNTRVVQFACSIKDPHVIERFFMLVVARTFESVETFQVHYEYEENVRHWFLNPGQFPSFTEVIKSDYRYLYGEPEHEGGFG